MKLAYYITSHGFGHGIRVCAIVNRLSSAVRLVLRTMLSPEFFHEEVMRPFEYVPGSFDCGCVQFDGVTVDIEKTIASYTAIAQRNAAALSDEIAWCRKNRIDGIVSDIVPFAFEVARGAGITSIAVSNFTWYDIYKDYCTDYPVFAPHLEKMRAQYAMADVLLKLPPPLPMEYFKNQIAVPAVGRKGAAIREKLMSAHGIKPGKQCGLIYTGAFGMESMQWKKIEEFREWEFFGLYPLGVTSANYHLLFKNDFRYEDIIASVDCVIGKIGYGVSTECMLNGTPLIYLPRQRFAEYPVLEKAIIEWGHGYRLSMDEFRNLQWKTALTKAVSRGRPLPMKSDGPMVCAGEIEKAVARHTIH